MTKSWTESTVRIGVILPDIMGTYGDDGNALVLRQRLQWRGYSAEIVRITLADEVPDSCDIYTIGGGEDSAQILACEHLRSSQGLQRACSAGRPVLAVCAGLQILGHWFVVSDGSRAPGLGLLDVVTCPQKERSIGEVLSRPTMAGLTQTLTGFENHQGATMLGDQARPLGTLLSGVGNGIPADTSVDTTCAPSPEGEGAVQDGIIATYMHGPALARNPELADLLLAKTLGVEKLEALDIPAVSQLRSERIAAAQRMG